MKRNTKPSMTPEAVRKRRIREDRDAHGKCRTCGEPAAVSKLTGQLAKQCKKHLACDVGRKLRVVGYMLDGSDKYPLTWHGRPSREYPPRWLP
jgi:hypothetical protein